MKFPAALLLLLCAGLPRLQATDPPGILTMGETPMEKRFREARESFQKAQDITAKLQADQAAYEKTKEMAEFRAAMDRAKEMERSDAPPGLPSDGVWTQIFDAKTSSEWRTYKDEKSGQVVSFNPKTGDVSRNPTNGKYEAYQTEPAKEASAPVATAAASRLPQIEESLFEKNWEITGRSNGFFTVRFKLQKDGTIVAPIAGSGKWTQAGDKLTLKFRGGRDVYTLSASNPRDAKAASMTREGWMDASDIYTVGPER